MSTNKKKPATKTLTFRLNSDVYEAITANAKAKDMSQGEYLLSQIAPDSELGLLIGSVAAKALLSQPAMKSVFVGFVSGLVSMKEKNNLSEESFNEAIEDSLDSLLNQKFGNQSLSE